MNEFDSLPDWAKQEIKKLRRECGSLRKRSNAATFEDLPGVWQRKLRTLRRENARLRYRLNHPESENTND